MPTDVDELAKLVATAKQATDSLDGTDLRRVAFERVLEHLLQNGTDGGSTHTGREQLAEASAERTSHSADGAFAEEQQRIDAIASYFKITPDEVPLLFDASQEDPTLALGTTRLSRPKAIATRQIALLVAGARTALGQETHTAHIRTEADNYGKLDSRNFMSVLRSMPEIYLLGKRGSSNRVIRMKVPGAEKAQELVQRIVSD